MKPARRIHAPHAFFRFHSVVQSIYLPRFEFLLHCRLMNAIIFLMQNYSMSSGNDERCEKARGETRTNGSSHLLGMYCFVLLDLQPFLAEVPCSDCPLLAVLEAIEDDGFRFLLLLFLPLLAPLVLPPSIVCLTV